MQLIATRPPEIIANIAICLLKQTDYLLAKLLEKISQDFLENGGFRETMTRMRIENRKKITTNKCNPTNHIAISPIFCRKNFCLALKYPNSLVSFLFSPTPKPQSKNIFYL
jgi:four helix bundle suffix protein